HAMAVVGYSIPEAQLNPFGPTGCLFRATGMARLYTHDDQVGPFAKLQFDRNDAVGTSWANKNTQAIGDIYLLPEVLLVPLYHKIRIPVSSITATVVAIDEWIEVARTSQLLPISQRLEWDVHLSEVPHFKEEIFSDRSALPIFRSEALEADLPRYL